MSRLRPRARAATGRPTEELYGRAGLLVQCWTCGLVRQDPRTVAPYEEAEDPDYLVEQDGHRETFRRILTGVARFRPPPGRLLDVGSGPGLLVEEACSLGWDAVGLEPSAWAVREAKSRGVDVRRGTIDDPYAVDGAFDVITMADVIEHVIDPLGAMQRVHDLLAPGGVVFVATPNVSSLAARTLRRWWWSVLPGHLYLFSEQTLTRLATEAGFQVVDTSTHPKTFSVDYYAGRLAGYSGALGRAARATMRVLADGKLITPDFRDRVALVARKPA